jgi:hypothetical protein
MNATPLTAPVSANDYLESIAEDKTRFNPEVEDGFGAPFLNWLLATDH